MLRPEKQDLGHVRRRRGRDRARRRRAWRCNYFEDGSVEAACPPLKALLHIMAHGYYEGKAVDDPGLRALFTRESLLASDWYRERLRTNSRATSRCGSAICGLSSDLPRGSGAADGLDIDARLAESRRQLARVSAPSYLRELDGNDRRRPVPRPVNAAHNPKHRIFGPAATAMYCFPRNSNVIGEAFIRTFVSKRHSVFPSRSSTASKPPFGFP